MTELLNWLKAKEKAFLDPRIEVRKTEFGNGLFATEGNFENQ